MDPDKKSDANSDLYSAPDHDLDPNLDSNLDPDPNSYPDPDLDSNLDPDPDFDLNSDLNPDPDPDLDFNLNSDPNSDPNPDSYDPDLSWDLWSWAMLGLLRSNPENIQFTKELKPLEAYTGLPAGLPLTRKRFRFFETVLSIHLNLQFLLRSVGEVYKDLDMMSSGLSFQKSFK